jgi:DNA-binding transcriptional MerR regulator
MLADEKKLQNIRVRMPEGAIYTVDEVSGLLGIPSPTLYRYLREYSIPHLRRAGRISIPEDSFDRIREARDLHKEGLGTESVRRRLREGSAPDTGELDRRLYSLHRTLEDLKGDIRERPTAEEVAFSPTLRTILARQSLLMSAMFNLTEMVEDLLLASGKPRKPLFHDLEATEVLPERPARDRLKIPGAVGAEVPTADRNEVDRTLAVGPTDFGALRRRRRRVVLAILAALIFVACLAWAIPALIGADNAESSVPGVTEPADDPLEAPKAMAAPGGSGLNGETKVPDVSGRSLEEAVRIISGAGFEVTAIRTEASRSDPETALRTEPPAGVPAKPGAPVTLTISGGPTGALPNDASASPSAGYAN